MEIQSFCNKFCYDFSLVSCRFLLCLIIIFLVRKILRFSQLDKSWALRFHRCRNAWTFLYTKLVLFSSFSNNFSISFSNAFIHLNIRRFIHLYKRFHENGMEKCWYFRRGFYHEVHGMNTTNWKIKKSAPKKNTFSNFMTLTGHHFVR